MNKGDTASHTAKAELLALKKEALKKFYEVGEEYGGLQKNQASEKVCELLSSNFREEMNRGRIIVLLLFLAPFTHQR